MDLPAGDQRLLLCRPASGLADALSQIALALRHGEAFGRTVIVETDYASANKFRHAFSNYFASADPKLVLDAAPYRTLFDTLTVAPAHLFGRVNACAVRWERASRGYVDVQTGLPMASDLSIDHPESLLVHHCTGFTEDAPAALARMRLRPHLVATLKERLGAIGGPYAAIHIRNTDFRTDYRRHLESVKGAMGRPIFVATDDAGALAYVRSLFGAEQVFSFADLPDPPGRPLHVLTVDDDVFRRNSDAILDLLMLAMARQLCIMPIGPNPYGSPYSGYSFLARQLKASSPRLLAQLLSGAETVEVSAPR